MNSVTETGSGRALALPLPVCALPMQAQMFTARHRRKMFGADARALPAEVMKDLPLGDWAHELLVGDSMGHHGSAAGSAVAVSPDRALPDPARSLVAAIRFLIAQLRSRPTAAMPGYVAEGLSHHVSARRIGVGGQRRLLTAAAVAQPFRVRPSALRWRGWHLPKSFEEVGR